MANNYGIFFRRGNALLRLPVNPETLPVERGGENETYNVLGIGPVMIPRDPDLKKISISGLFPARAYPWVLTAGGFEPPEFYIQFFESAMADKAPIVYTPVRYMEDGAAFDASDTGFVCLVTQFDTEERGGETGDFYYTLEITEYRYYSPRTMQIQGGGNASAAGGTAVSAGYAGAARSALGQAATAQAESTGPLRVSTQKERSAPQGRLYVGATVQANGPYYRDSAGELPAGQANSIQAAVVRIESADPPPLFPVFLRTEKGPLGWMKKEALRAASER